MVSFSSKGKAYLISRKDDSANRKKIAEKVKWQLIREGAFTIFQIRNGMLPKSDYHHYVKPSSKRVDQFVRAGNTLVDGSEIDFLSLGVIGYLSEKTKIVYTDSHTINSLIYSGVLLWNQFSVTKVISPRIKSYESYSGFDSESFSGVDRGFVVVSASSGGAMLRGLVKKKGVSNDKILTLFLFG